jgi:hypothetical protein
MASLHTVFTRERERELLGAGESNYCMCVEATQHAGSIDIDPVGNQSLLKTCRPVLKRSPRVPSGSAIAFQESVSHPCNACDPRDKATHGSVIDISTHATQLHLGLRLRRRRIVSAAPIPMPSDDLYTSSGGRTWKRAGQCPSVSLAGPRVPTRANGG